MAKTKRRSADTDSYRYGSATRSNLPTEQTEPLMSEGDKAPRPFTPVRRKRDDEPVLAWARDSAGADQTYDAYPLYVREKVHPGAFVESLKSGTGAPATLFEDFNGLPSENAAYEWYEHAGNWQNRIIHGESDRVMASLAEREHLSGRVQMIYFDPPYGIGFKSNFQVSTRGRETADGRKGLPCDPQTIRAFRDTYERGVHSYLDQMLERLVLCRGLLAESGSVFVQIGDENVHRMAVVLDEVFGTENRVATIPFVTSGSSSSSTLSSIADFLLWYAKDKAEMKYHQLYEPLTRAEKIEHMSSYAMVEFADGTTGTLTAEQRDNPDANLPDGARIYRRMPLASPGTSTTGRSDTYYWNGQHWPCPRGEQWRVSMEGMERLDQLGRLDAAGPGSTLSWKRYEHEVPGRRVHNVWHRQMSTSDKRYVVQTAEQVIERCLLMATDPGDLVFDPTCGGATTALVAERWGRRWITCDTSPVSVAIARQRIATAAFEYWTPADSANGSAVEAEFSGSAVADAPQGGWGHDPARGFVYQRVPKVSAAKLAYDHNSEPELLVDRPHSTKGVTRVASPFTVESSSPWSHVPFDGAAAATPASHADFTQAVVEALPRSPIRASRPGDNSETPDIHIREIMVWPGRKGVISHLVTYTVGGGSREQRAGLLVAPEDATATMAMLRRAALDSAVSIDAAKLVIVVAFAFAPDTSDAHTLGSVQMVRVQMHRDLQIRDLRDDDDHHAFVIVGQPDIQIHDEGNDMVSVELRGYDTYNPATGNATAGKAQDVACWIIDTDHDGVSFFARRIHFPGADDDKQIKRLQRQLGSALDMLRWNAVLSTCSAPFAVPESGEIAVKIITTTGMEMSLVAKVPAPT